MVASMLTIPLQLADRIRLGLGVGQQPVPGAVASPAHEPVIAGLPRAVALGQVPPGRAGAQLPQDAVDHRAVVAPTAAAAAVAWQQRRQLRPRRIGELSAANHCVSNLHQLKAYRAGGSYQTPSGQTRPSPTVAVRLG